MIFAWLRRRRLLREAEALEQEARVARRSMVERLARVDRCVGLAGLVGAFAAGAVEATQTGTARQVAGAVRTALTEQPGAARAADLEARARALREEAASRWT